MYTTNASVPKYPIWCSDDGVSILPKFGAVGPLLWGVKFESPPPHEKICQIVNNSAVDCSIELKFCTEFEHATLDVLQDV